LRFHLISYAELSWSFWELTWKGCVAEEKGERKKERTRFVFVGKKIAEIALKK
jgi:hypothetical protein